MKENETHGSLGIVGDGEVPDDVVRSDIENSDDVLASAPQLSSVHHQHLVDCDRCRRCCVVNNNNY